MAFGLWNGEQDVSEFVAEFMSVYPAFTEYWTAEELAAALDARR